MVKFVDAVGQGMGVARDIGDSDPVRTSPPNIAKYLEDRRADWKKANIDFKVEEVMDNQAKYPMAFVVNRATNGRIISKPLLPVFL